MKGETSEGREASLCGPEEGGDVGVVASESEVEGGIPIFVLQGSSPPVSDVTSGSERDGSRAHFEVLIGACADEDLHDREVACKVRPTVSPRKLGDLVGLAAIDRDRPTSICCELEWGEAEGVWLVERAALAFLGGEECA